MKSPLQIIPKNDGTAPTSSDIDEFGELDRQVRLMAPILDRHKVLKENFEKYLESAPGDKPAKLVGESYEIQLSARRRERLITNRRMAFTLLKKAVGLDGLLAVIEIPFGALIDKHIPESQQKKFVIEERSGWRSLTVVALHPPAAA